MPMGQLFMVAKHLAAQWHIVAQGIVSGCTWGGGWPAHRPPPHAPASGRQDRAQPHPWKRNRDYALLLSPSATPSQIGRLGQCVRPGRVYVGSACGPGGVRARGAPPKPVVATTLATSII
jgi:hypothetical protein